MSCPADHFTGPLLVNEHRHVAQRNLTILEPAQDAKELMLTLGRLVPKGFTLELTHGGPAAVPLLLALGGGALPVFGGEKHVPITAPALDEIHGGVDIGASVHLLTAFEARNGGVRSATSAMHRCALACSTGSSGCST